MSSVGYRMSSSLVVLGIAKTRRYASAMKNTIRIICLSVVFGGCTRPSPALHTIDEVAQALGGKERIQQLKTLTIEGEGEAPNLGQNITPNAPLPVWKVAGFHRTSIWRTSELGFASCARRNFFLPAKPSRSWTRVSTASLDTTSMRMAWSRGRQVLWFATVVSKRFNIRWFSFARRWIQKPRSTICGSSTIRNKSISPRHGETC